MKFRKGPIKTGCSSVELCETQDLTGGRGDNGNQGKKGKYYKVAEALTRLTDSAARIARKSIAVIYTPG